MVASTMLSKGKGEEHLDGKGGTIVLGEQFLNVWQENIKIKVVQNKCSLYHWKVLKHRYLKWSCIFHWDFELKVVTKKKIDNKIFQVLLPLEKKGD